MAFELLQFFIFYTLPNIPFWLSCVLHFLFFIWHGLLTLRVLHLQWYLTHLCSSLSILHPIYILWLCVLHCILYCFLYCILYWICIAFCSAHLKSTPQFILFGGRHWFLSLFPISSIVNLTFVIDVDVSKSIPRG